MVQVNLFQKHSFLNQLTHNMTADCSLIPDFSTRIIQLENMLCTVWTSNVVPAEIVRRPPAESPDNFRRYNIAGPHGKFCAIQVLT